MFGLSIEHLLILALAGLFILGPERLPQAAASLAKVVRQVRSYASSAQKQLESELGTDLEEIRKPLRDLGSLRDPRQAVTRYLLDDHADEPARAPLPPAPDPATVPQSPVSPASPGSEAPASSRKAAGVDFEAT